MQPQQNNPTAATVAAWMAAALKAKGELYQEDAVTVIERQFGKQFLRENDDGNQVLGLDVLKEFRKLNGDTVVWERGEKRWRKRESTDDPGRRQD